MTSALSKCARICKPSQNGLLRPLVHQRFGSSHSNEPKLPEEFVFEEPVFKSVWWKRSALGLIGLYALNKFDDYYYKEGVHPVTRWIAYNMENEEESLRKNTIVIREAQERARRRLIDLEPRKIFNHRIMTPDLFTRASQHSIEPGSQIDLSDLVIRYN